MAKYEFGQSLYALNDTSAEEARAMLARNVGGAVFQWASKHKVGRFSVRFLQDFQRRETQDIPGETSYETRVQVITSDLDNKEN